MEETVRVARLADREILRSLAAEARAELSDKKGGDVDERLDPHRADSRAGIVNAVEDPDATLLLGDIDGTPVGYGLMTLRSVVDGSSHATVEEIFVLPEARSVGVGEAIIKALLDDARERGAVAVQSTALPGDRATKNFFESQGMVARSILVHRWLDGR